ncbi:peptide chain release factor N(5)-glutamine methyltransferase [Candidatus Saccharibacteria bacterium]|nr:peptide chain release factor N(5)-glutamine methyltransferase [Candidatus Saccharibacteria bacterium]MCL1962749.1 peptide chain release factor N(5)-glutamine methyltransferase [Candidatus Saccharibacteria bacterium]
MIVVSEWLKNAGDSLRGVGIDSARLDAELILSFALEKSREWIAAHGDSPLSDKQIEPLNLLLTHRINREPISYILKKKEFYGREFTVTPDVLIPRPETEQIVEIIKEIFLEQIFSKRCSILDIGTGSGAIAVTLALEMPNVKVVGTDISESALAVAEKNRERFGANVKFLQSDLFENPEITADFDVIAANLPYVDRNWQVSPETAFEPEIALFADDEGLKLIKKLIRQAPNYLRTGGFLVLEMNPRQIEPVKIFAKEYGFEVYDEKFFILTLRLQNMVK